MEGIVRMQVKKRDGTLQDWNPSKIWTAIRKAFASLEPEDFRGSDNSTVESMVDKVVDRVYTLLNIDYSSVADSTMTVDIEMVQDKVEQALMLKNHHDVARVYILYRAERARMRSEAEGLVPDSKELARYIHPAKYGRWQKELQRRETFDETVDRVMDMHRRKFPDMKSDIDFASEAVKSNLCLPSMRSMQFAGKPLENHNPRMYNCSYTLIDRDRVFGDVLYLLLCGCGVGYSVQWRHVNKLPEVKVRPDVHQYVEHFDIQDTIIGWADSVHVLLDSYFHSNHYIEFNYSFIRREGAALKTSGGKAPGHLPLKKLHESLRTILDPSQGRQLRPIEVYDILCHIAECVLAGGIRRSSTIAIFSKDDPEMLYAKHPWEFRHNGKNSQRAMSNNSVFLPRDCSEEEFRRVLDLNRKNHNGEPGFFFSDHPDWGTNPCGEIGLNPVEYEEPDSEEHQNKMEAHGFRRDPMYPDGLVRTGFAFCNLCEINVAACKTATEFFRACRAATILGTLQASYTNFLYIGEASEVIAKRDALLGIGLCGIQDNPDIGLDPHILARGASVVEESNRFYSKKIGINIARSLTCVKPGGTAPLELGGVASGISCHHAKRYLRRVTANPLEAPAQFFLMHNPHAVEHKPNGDLALVFPVQAPAGSKTVKDSTAIEQFLDVQTVYNHWVLPGSIAHGTDRSGRFLGHNVSCTIVFRDEEWENLMERIWADRSTVTAMSFLPLTSDKGIPFMPREEIITRVDEAYWKELIQNWTTVDYSKMNETEDGTVHTQEPACASGQCNV